MAPRKSKTRDYVSVPSDNEAKSYKTERAADLWANNLDPLNQIDWRDSTKKIADPKTDHRRAMIDGTITQSKGKKEKKSCSRCVAGMGPFASCVRLQSEDGKYTLNGRCANCHVYNQGPNCNLPRASTTTKSTPGTSGSEVGTVSKGGSQKTRAVSDCICAEEGRACAANHCECTDVDNPFNHLAVMLEDPEFKATPCLISRITHYQKDTSLEKLENMMITSARVRDSLEAVCATDAKLARYLEALKNSSEEEKPNMTLEILRYGLTDTIEKPAVGSAKDPKSSYFSLCEREWVSVNEKDHCMRCHNCRMWKTYTHCKKCRFCTTPEVKDGVAVCDRCGLEKPEFEVLAEESSSPSSSAQS